MDNLEEVPDSPPPIAPVLTGRITVVNTIAFQSADTPASDVDSRFSIRVVSDETPVLKSIKITSQWERLKGYWLESCSQVFIRNDEGLVSLKYPTPEERESNSRKVIELIFSPSGLIPETSQEGQILLLPGESVRFRPRTLTNLWVRRKPAPEVEPLKATLFLLPE